MVTDEITDPGSVSTYQALADALTRRIAKMRPGERVPSEHDLAEAHDVTAWGTAYLPADLVGDLGDRLPPTGSLFRTLRDDYGLEPHREWSRAELDVPPARVPGQLGLDGRPLMWSLHSGNRSAILGRPLEISCGWLRADIFRVLFELGPA